MDLIFNGEICFVRWSLNISLWIWQLLTSQKNFQTFDISKGFAIRDISDSFFSMLFEVKILKCVISTWNFNMGIWNLNMESCICNYFNHLENFSGHRRFFGSGKQKKLGEFLIFFSIWSTWTKSFMLWKLSEKSYGVFFLLVG